MVATDLLLGRLNEIGRKLATQTDALALIGLGSVGLETDRLDAYSDLDFFVIVQAGSKPRYLADLTWLTDLAPVAYNFRNTDDGYKLLYQDNVFCEFAVFEPDELAQASFSTGRIIWRADGVTDTIGVPLHPPRHPEPPSTAHRIGEALTNLYVGLLRDRRGEKLAAMRHIQVWALDHALALAASTLAPTAVSRDLFNAERRLEQRYPQLAPIVASFAQGYESNRASAAAILAFLDAHFAVDAAMKHKLEQLLAA